MMANPLRIDALPLPGQGTIGLTFCPGKQDANGLAGPHDRDLETDMRAIADWGPKALVTLMEAWEMDHLGVPDLGPAAERLGLDWHWLPLPDGGAPDGAFERWWRYCGPRLRRHLRAGDGVVVHCRGGLGRAGVYAAGRGQDFRDAVRIGASHGGDSDSTAAIAGQLNGARTGIQDLPHAWVRRLDVAEPLLDPAADGPIG